MPNTSATPTPLDVLCVGHASYDLVFSIPHHPGADEKMVADSLLGCGGGPAANAAVTVAKLGFSAGFCGYLGNDVYGDCHLQELHSHGVDTRLVVRGGSPTPLSGVLVKPDGQRALINYKGDTKALAADSIDFNGISAKAILFDGHEPRVSLCLLAQIAGDTVPTVLDAGSVHDGTLALMDKIDYLVCSEKFAVQYAGDPMLALTKLAALAPVVVITLGEHGLIWQRGQESGRLSAPPIKAIDTTGAGDAFHGAFSCALAAKMEWRELLRYASAAGAYCCTQMGARPGLPSCEQHQALLANWSPNA
ncbi:PfkB family carbohydrate kinase [Methylomonas montana]|uniref:carbohydrate kinase family protein n=1 Tax=Methylomonas montana TaxID=3058963 RepID=UPI0026587B31|nr:PfkB family carbohydrate kinase [Methylomonas montana]WKJ88824.1 PfkB family carbohydrate kinase [Methylomonas montana]